MAFTQSTTTLGMASCTPGSSVEPWQLKGSRQDNLLVWQLRPNGTYRSTVVQTITDEQPSSASSSSIWPTGAIVTDNMNGLLIPVRWRHGRPSAPPGEVTEEFIYRIDPDGNLVYKFPVPVTTGSLHDEMVIGENDVAFATRGGLLIAFNVRTGKELWRWDSKAPEITVFAALANGGCMVQTPATVVEVDNSTTSKEVLKGKAMLDWQGRLFRKDD